MKKIVVIFILLTGYVFADSGFHYTVGLGSAYPLTENDFKASDYLIISANIYTTFDYTFNTDSNMFAPGIGLVARINALTLISNNFFGTLGLRLYNTLDFGEIELRPYVESNFVFYSYGDTSSSSDAIIPLSYLDISAGLSLTILNFDLDVAYVLPPAVKPLLLPDILNTSAVRFSISYRK